MAGVARAITPLARAQLNKGARALVQEVYRCVPLDMARRVVFVGGAAHAALFGATVKAQVRAVS